MYNRKTITNYEELFNLMNRMEEEAEESWIDCGLLPSEVINNKLFISWVRKNKPLTYKNAIVNASKYSIDLENLVLDVLLSFFVGGFAYDFISVSGTSQIKNTIDISTEYPLTENFCKKYNINDFSDIYQMELIAEYCFQNGKAFDYLCEIFNEYL